MRRIYLSTAFICALFFIFSCTSTEEMINDKANEHSVKIYVDNSKGIDPVHIRVSIYKLDRKEKQVPSEKVIIDEDFSYVPYSPKGFNLKLEDGTYVFHIETNNGDYKLNVNVEINKPMWFILTYVDKDYFQFIPLYHQPIWG